MSSFAVQLKAFADKTNARANIIVRKTTVDIATELEDLSPVGDPTTWKNPAPKGYVGGRFRGNWQLGVNAVPAGETGRIDPSGGATLNEVIASIPPQPAGTVLYLANNVPYAQRLEEGWSPQAPDGLVEITALKFQQIVDSAAGAA